MNPEQKSKEAKLCALRSDLKKANGALEEKRKELDRRIAGEQPKLFEDETKLFDQVIDPKQRKAILSPYKALVLKLEQDIKKLEKQEINGTGSLF